MTKTVFSKTVKISSIVASAKTTIGNSTHTDYITENDINQFAPFTNALILNKSSTTDVTLKIIRCFLNSNSKRSFDVPANNGSAVVENELFENIEIENLDSANNTGAITVRVSKEVD
ncbi:MAG: hypothetical protein HYW92_03840 [Nitrosarchaeum sp.]|nr:hypothetical protein [Nitrosarchaeum sp.]